MSSPCILVRNVADAASLTLLGARTIGDVKTEIERIMNIPIERQILVGHKAQTHGLVVNTQPGQTLLLNPQPGQPLIVANAMVMNGQYLLLDNDVLNTQLEINVIDVYRKISPPRPVEIEIIHTDPLHRHEVTILSDKTVAHLRREIDMQLPMTTYRRRLTTLQAVMANEDHQLCEYLLDPFPEGSKQVIMVEEERPSACFICCCNM